MSKLTNRKKTKTKTKKSYKLFFFKRNQTDSGIENYNDRDEKLERFDIAFEMPEERVSMEIGQ